MVYKGDTIEPPFLVLSEDDINTPVMQVPPEILSCGRTLQCSGYDCFGLRSKMLFLQFLL